MALFASAKVEHIFDSPKQNEFFLLRNVLFSLSRPFSERLEGNFTPQWSTFAPTYYVLCLLKYEIGCHCTPYPKI